MKMAIWVVDTAGNGRKDRGRPVRSGAVAGHRRLALMVLIRVVSLVLALIEAVLALRLLFPFMRIPKSLDDYVPILVTLSDWLMAPFKVFLQPFSLEELSKLPGGNELGYTQYLDRLDTSVLVAMVGWAIIGSLVLLVLRMVARAH